MQKWQTPESRPVHDIHYLTPNNTLLWVHTRVSLHSRMYTRYISFAPLLHISFPFLFFFFFFFCFGVNVTTIPRIECRPLSLLIILPSAICVMFPRVATCIMLSREFRSTRVNIAYTPLCLGKLRTSMYCVSTVKHGTR